MVEASKSLAIKNQVQTALDLRYKNRKKLQEIGLSYFIGKNYFDADGL